MSEESPPEEISGEQQIPEPEKDQQGQTTASTPQSERKLEE